MRALAIVALIVASASLAADSDLVDPASPEVLQFARDARSVYIFPFKPNSELVDTSRLRLLRRNARNSLVTIIADPAHWEHGFLTYVVPEDLPPDIGLLFRHGSNELALFCSDWGIHATFRGKRGWSDLTEEAKKQLQKWKQQYAVPECGRSGPAPGHLW